MNWHNRHLSDILDLFRTFVGHKRENEEEAGVNEKMNAGISVGIYLAILANICSKGAER
jgi:hypothetical protein